MEVENECLLRNYPEPIMLPQLYKILYHMENCICRIKINERSATGFFWNIPIIKNGEKELKIPVLITNNHMINNDIIANKNKKIIYKIKKEGKFNSFELNSELNRFINTNEELDVTIIELKKSDNINHFLEIDDNIINSGDNSGYINESIYVIQYPKRHLSLSSGIVADIDAE